MQCNAVMSAVLVLLLLLMLLREGTSGRPQRAKRRVPPRLDKPLSLEELKFECCSQPWTDCCTEAAALLDSNSTTNTDHAQCVQEARQQLYQEAASPVVSLVANPVVNPNPSPVLRPVVDSVVDSVVNYVAHSVEKGANCSLSKKQRKAARNMYCDYLRLLDSTWIYGLLSDMQNWAASGCVRFYNSTQFRSPHQIFEGIALWHKKWTNRHRCCYPFTTLRTALSSTGTLRCTNGESKITHRWDAHLTRVTQMMHMLELLRNTGRRRKCLRGCVSEREVRCSNLM